MNEAVLGERVVIRCLAKIKLVKGIDELSQKAELTVSINNGKLNIDDGGFAIPLNRVKEASVFTVKEVEVDNLLRPGTVTQNPLYLKVISFLTSIKEIMIFIMAKKVTLLSLDFIDSEGRSQNGLFVADNEPYLKSFADALNREIDKQQQSFSRL